MNILAVRRRDDEGTTLAGRIAAAARNAWFYRPILTTRQAQLNAHADAYSDGFTRGLDHQRAATAAMPAGQRAGSARTTSTGVTLTVAGGAA